LSHGNEPGRLFAILVTYKRPEALSTMLDRLSRQVRQPDHLVVVDNSPSIQTESLVRVYAELGHTVDYLPAPENLGPAGGIALGMEQILSLAQDSEWVILIDDDNPPPTNHLFDDLVRFAQQMLEADSSTGAVGLGGSIFDLRRARLVRLGDRELDGPVVLDHIPGNLFPVYLMGAIRQVGIFRRELFFGFEELEFGLRLRRAGYTIYAPGPIVRHLRTVHAGSGMPPRRGPTVGLPEPDWRRYYSLRNLIYILRLHGHGPAALRVSLARGVGKPLVSLPIRPRRALAHLTSNLRALRHGWTGRMGRTIYPDPSVSRVQRRRRS
jgi:rhamnopyranosyl-N-acetylglucosaminyl-diphospho-decaprenol beta-1,3/1,4-galactofuranosyltransferase